eukprot:824173-Prymnesium_polylepis.1
MHPRHSAAVPTPVDGVAVRKALPFPFGAGRQILETLNLGGKRERRSSGHQQPKQQRQTHVRQLQQSLVKYSKESRAVAVTEPRSRRS